MLSAIFLIYRMFGCWNLMLNISALVDVEMNIDYIVKI